MLSYKERLAKALKHAQVSDTALSKHLGISIQAVRKVAAGTTIAFTAENNSRTAAFLRVDPDWLATGDGNMENVRGWPGTQYTLEQIHGWPEELIRKVEDVAEGYLAAMANPNTTVHKHSNNQFTLDDNGNPTVKLSSETKLGKTHGPRDSVPSHRQAKG